MYLAQLVDKVTAPNWSVNRCLLDLFLADVLDFQFLMSVGGLFHDSVL